MTSNARFVLELLGFVRNLSHFWSLGKCYISVNVCQKLDDASIFPANRSILYQNEFVASKLDMSAFFQLKDQFNAKMSISPWIFDKQA